MKAEVVVSRWPIAGGFRISRGTKHEAVVVEVTVVGDGSWGRGEAVPYSRYGESVEAVEAELRQLVLEDGDRQDQWADASAQLKLGAARNAVDCALWDWDSRRLGQPACALAGVQRPSPVPTAYTLSVDTPAAMADKARRERGRPCFKLKASGQDDLARIEAVHAACPETPLIVDANEGWSVADYRTMAPVLGALGVMLIEQPFAADADGALATLPRPVPVCADESFMRRSQLVEIARRYDAVNVKLDKTGGFTEALACVRAARSQGLQVMLGCNVCTSLGIAPSFLLVGEADYVDLDGPLLLTRDRVGGAIWDGTRLHPPALWGSEEDARAHPKA